MSEKEKMLDENGYEIWPNSFKLFENNKKKTDKQPDYTGKMYDEDGVEYFISAWVKESKKGKDYLSGNITLASEAREKWGNKDDDSQPAKSLPPKKEVVGSGDESLDDDLPF